MRLNNLIYTTFLLLLSTAIALPIAQDVPVGTGPVTLCKLTLKDQHQIDRTDLSQAGSGAQSAPIPGSVQSTGTDFNQIDTASDSSTLPGVVPGVTVGCPPAPPATSSDGTTTQTVDGWSWSFANGIAFSCVPAS